MFTTIKIKRICKKFKAPDVEIPVLTAAPKRRVNIKFAYATAALALVIFGASVLGIKGNIFGHTPPLTPDTSNTPDTPTPPDDDVKIIYADSALLTENMMSISAGELVVDATLQKSIKENEGCKFAVYVKLSNNDILYRDDSIDDERYSELVEINIISSNLWNKFYNILRIIHDGNDFNSYSYEEFSALCSKLDLALVKYEERHSDEENPLYFNKAELETINDVLSLTKDDFNNKDKEKLKELLETYSTVLSDFEFRLSYYKYELHYSSTDEIIGYFEKIGVKLERLNKEQFRVFHPTILSRVLTVYEATLSKEEIHSLEGTEYGVYIFGRGENMPFAINL